MAAEQKHLVLRNKDESYISLKPIGGYQTFAVDKLLVNGEACDVAPGSADFAIWRLPDEIATIEVVVPGSRPLAYYKKKAEFEGTKHPETVPTLYNSDGELEEWSVLYDPVYEERPETRRPLPFVVVDATAPPKPLPTGVKPADIGYLGQYPFLWHTGKVQATEDFYWPRLAAAVKEAVAPYSYMSLTCYNSTKHIAVSARVELPALVIVPKASGGSLYQYNRPTYGQPPVIPGDNLLDCIVKVDAWVLAQVKPIYDFVATKDAVFQALAALNISTTPVAKVKPKGRRR